MTQSSCPSLGLFWASLITEKDRKGQERTEMDTEKDPKNNIQRKRTTSLL